MQKCYSVIGTYNHVPEGAEESSLEETYQVCWRPYLSALYRFPDISAVLHYSGTALSWLEARHPEFLMLLEEMAAKKQIELLGGGFFAPLLPLVPGPDRLGQIELLTTYIRKAFGKRPRGCWMQDYAWEPGLASTIQTCGFDYSFLPERQFRLSGASLGMPALTEDQGRSLMIFPVFDALESFPALLPPDLAVAAIRERGEDLPLISVMYPGEAARELWEKSGLESPDVLFERSFAELQKESLLCETTTPNKYLRFAKQSGRAYFSSGASSVLMERSLPPVAAGRGCEQPSEIHGSSRRLLLRHAESNSLYAKMQYVRILVSQLRGDKSRKKSAQEELWRGQCGDAYWPGPNGGLLRLPVRAAAFASLIQAERTTRQRGTFSPGVIMADIDFDGIKEILYQGSDFNAYVHLKGGSLFELDSLKTLTNYVNVLSDYEDIGECLPQRRCFRDGFCESGSFDLEGLADESPYSLEESDRPAHLAVLTREASLAIGGRKRSVFIRKKYAFRKVALSVIYELTNRENDALAFRFFTELNFAAGSNPEGVALEGLRDGNEKIVISNAEATTQDSLDFLRITNTKAEEHLEIRADRSFELGSRPLFHATQLGGQSRELYEGAAFLLGWDLAIPPGSSLKIAIALEIRS